MQEFKLVNPLIAGTFVDTYKTESPNKAAEEFWNQFAGGKYISGELKRFYFTLMNTEDNKLSHFKVEEKRKGSNAEFTITPVTGGGISKDSEKKFLSKVQEVAKSIDGQSGGKHRRRRYEDDDSSSSSSSDDDDLLKYIRRKRAVRPLTYWWYAPTLYNVDYTFVPTFTAPNAPYYQLWLPTL